MLRLAAIVSTIILYVASIWGSQFGLSTATPTPNSKVASIQDITLVFDLTQVKEEYPDVSTWYIGCNAMGGACTIDLMKGSEIVAQITDEFDLHEGDSYPIRFDNPVLLEPDVEYTLVIPEYSFSLYTENYWGGYVTDCSNITLTYIGEASAQNVLVLESTLPEKGSSIALLNNVDFNFNESVSILPNTPVEIVRNNDNVIIASTVLRISDNPNTVSALFDDIELYNSYSYTVRVPEQSIFLEGETENGYQEILVNYTGASYNYFGYGRISPSNNSEVEYLSRISVPVKLEAGAQYIGRDFKATACMYKVEGEERTLVADAIECNINEATNGFYINVFDFALEPSSTYQIEVEKDSFHLWSADTQKPLYDTSNETLTLTYTTPAEIAPLAVQEFGEVTPVASEPLEKLEAFKVMLAPYEFENTFYYPEFLSSAAEGYNVVSVVDVTDNSEVTSFKVDIKWDTDNNYWLENIEPLDVTLFEGRSYEVRVPAGMVCCRYDPIRELTANKDFAVTYNGGYSPNCEFTYSVSGLSDVTTTVAKGSTVTVNVAPAENFKVESVIFNGEEAALSGDSFTTPALDSDEALLEVTFAYDGTILFDFTTGVDDIADCPFKVWSNDDHIVIENVTVGADIKVYSVAGVLIADTTATDEVVNISVLPGVYVVVIDGVGLKVKH